MSWYTELKSYAIVAMFSGMLLELLEEDDHEISICVTALGASFKSMQVGE